MTKNLNGEGTYYYLASRSRWYVQFTDVNGKRVMRVAKPNTEAGARSTLRKYLANRERGENTPARSPSLAEFTETWLEAKRTARCRPRTIEAYRERVTQYVLPTLGAMKLDRLQPMHLDTLYASLTTKTGRPLSASTITSVHLALGNLLRLAHRRRLVPRVVTDLVTAPRVDSYEARTLTVDEVRTLISGLDEHRHGPLWVFLLGTGCRFGEAAGLTWDHINLDAGTVSIVQQATRERVDGRVTYVIATAKTRAGRRTVALPDFAIAALKRQRELISLLEIPNPQNLVFPSVRGNILPENNVLVSWHRALVDLALPPIRMHDLRHTKGTLMADSGEEITTIQRTLGHARLNITSDIYIGNTSTALKRAADRFNDLVQPKENDGE